MRSHSANEEGRAFSDRGGKSKTEMSGERAAERPWRIRQKRYSRNKALGYFPLVDDRRITNNLLLNSLKARLREPDEQRYGANAALLFQAKHSI